MLGRLAAHLSHALRGRTPDPFVLAIGLTLLTAALALGLTPATPAAVLAAWQGPDGFFRLLAFSMQMCLVLVTGHALAAAPAVARALAWLAERPRTPGAAAAWVAALTIATSLLNWGFGLIVGATLARAVGRSLEARGIRAHYPVLCAAGYSGMLTWHGGFSGSAPLKVTTAADLRELLGAELSARVAPIGLEQTILSPLNLLVCGGLLLALPLLFARLMATTTPEPASAFLSAEAAPPAAAAAGLDHSPWVAAALWLPLLAAVVTYFRQNGVGRLDPNAVNLTLLTAGLILHRHPASYLRAVEAASRGCAGIILQFPLYAGIMGIMTGTGLSEIFAQWAVAGSGSAGAYAVLTFLVAGLINLFVPSGGAQWAVQGAIAIAGALQLGLPLGTAVLAVAYGDQWSNMLQPFWALPLLAITGVAARDIIGYTALAMLLSAVWFIGCLWLAA